LSGGGWSVGVPEVVKDDSIQFRVVWEAAGSFSVKVDRLTKGCQLELHRLSWDC
jgi:hypothetical protein